ncbi:MAG: riboflavin biosynthesis protein RibF [Myxococcota bacterium]
MKVYWSTDELPDPPLEPIATLGNMDGVHRGHQTILSRLAEEGERTQSPTMVVTFQPHTRKVLKPQDDFRPLMTTVEKMRRFYELGVQHVLVLPFAEGVSEMTASEFVEEILWEPLRVRSMFVGPDCAFGRDRVGDLRFLSSEGRRLGFHVGQVDPLVSGRTRISSSIVREAIAHGDLETANKMLGRDHVITGTVLRGFRMGRELGFPTANIRDEGICLPPHGVYVGMATLQDDSQHGCMLNIGMRPTFQGESLSIEAHLFNWEGNIYGQELRVSLRARLRSEIAFPNADALKAQLRRDAVEARKILGIKKADRE